MRSVVVDASAALAWVLPSQATPAAGAMLDQANSLHFEAPAIFDWEVRNVLLKVERRGAIPPEEHDEALLFYAALNVQLHAPAIDMDELGALARANRLSLFDAAYLALAVEHGWPLASRDDALLKAAASAGIECFDLRATTR